MIILLDTCDFLWYVSGDRSLASNSRSEIENPNNTVFLSVVSLWEIIIKQSLGKLALPRPAADYVPEQRDRHQILALDLAESAVKRLATLPPIHRDPFDRMLICQAQDLQMTFASSDPVVRQYPVTVL
jgi:PIN domain nuclease of toxin-antitoxin system